MAERLRANVKSFRSLVFNKKLSEIKTPSHVFQQNFFFDLDEKVIVINAENQSTLNKKIPNLPVRKDDALAREGNNYLVYKKIRETCVSMFFSVSGFEGFLEIHDALGTEIAVEDFNPNGLCSKYL